MNDKIFLIFIFLWNFSTAFNEAANSENQNIGGFGEMLNSGCENGQICAKGTCPIYHFLRPTDSLFVQHNSQINRHRRKKREFVLITFFMTGWIYKYIVAWVIPQLVLNEVCKNTGLDEKIIDCFKMWFLKRRLSCKLPKPIRHSAKFANDVIDIAMKEATNDAKALIDSRYQKFAAKVHDLPPLDFDFGADPKMSLTKLREAGLISLEPGMVPAAFDEDNEKIMKKEGGEKKKEEMAKKKGGGGGFFGQIGLRLRISTAINGWKQKSKEQMLEEEIEEKMLEMETQIELHDKLMEFEEILIKEQEKELEKELKNFEENFVEFKVKFMEKQKNELEEFEKEQKNELGELEKAKQKQVEKLRAKKDREYRERMAEKKEHLRGEILEKMKQEKRIDLEKIKSEKNDENNENNPLLVRRQKRFVFAPIAAGIFSFFTYNFVRRFAMRVAIKNVNIWLFLKRCFRASMSAKTLKCKVPERFVEEQKFLREVLKIILQDLSPAAIGAIRIRYELFKSKFPMPITRGKPVAEHEKLSKFLENVFSGINMAEKFKDQMDGPIREAEMNEIKNSKNISKEE